MTAAAAAAAAAAAPAAVVRPGTVPSAPRVERWSLWGTYACLAVADPRRLPTARALADDLLDRIGRACSRFRDDSDLSAVNRHPGEWVGVDPLLVAAVRAALWAADATDGLVDPCLGRALITLGYDDDLAAVRERPDRPVPPSLSDHPTRAGAWRDVLVTDDAVRVPVGVSLDLGATAKAWAADLLAEHVVAALDCTAVVSLGGDVRVAGPGAAATWPVRVAEAVDEPAAAEAGQQVIVSGGLATSTTVVRRWRSGSVLHHHLLDPATGRPAPAPYRTVTAGGRSCLAANTASTAAVVLGHEAPRWLAAHGVSARLVAQDGTVTPVGDWPADAAVVVAAEEGRS